MSRPLTVTRPAAAADLTAALRTTKRTVEQIRCRAVLAVARGQSVPQAAQVLHVSARAVRNWVRAYNAQGVPGLQDRRRGRRFRLSATQAEQLKARILAGPQPGDGVCSLRGADIQRILKAEHQVALSRNGVYYVLHQQLGLRSLQPRPQHRQADPQAQAAFKKTAPRCSPPSKPPSRGDGWRSGSRTRAASGNRAR